MEPTPPSTEHGPSPRLADAAVGVVSAVLLLAASWADAGARWITSPRPLDAVAVGLIVVAAGALTVRRRYPLSVLVVLNAIALAWAVGRYPGAFVMLTPLAAVYMLAALRGWRWGLVATVGSALTFLVAIRIAFGAADPVGTNGIAVMMATTAGAAGAAAGYYRALLTSLRTQVAREAETREAQARHQAVEERMRVARELHDVFGHTLATISVQAGTAIHVTEARPTQAAEALATIKRISDQGLTDVKTILGVLRSDDGTDLPRGPRGSLDQLDDLLDPVRAAGVHARVEVRGTVRPLPAAVDLAAYRIIQEATTNVLRHADAQSLHLELSYEPSQVVIRIVDDGPAGGSDHAAAVAEDGHGISGMRERVSALSGRFSAGPLPGGGFEVRCSLPTADHEGGSRATTAGEHASWSSEPNALSQQAPSPGGQA